MAFVTKHLSHDASVNTAEDGLLRLTVLAWRYLYLPPEGKTTQAPLFRDPQWLIQTKDALLGINTKINFIFLIKMFNSVVEF